jgi:hypothetical protein
MGRLCMGNYILPDRVDWSSLPKSPRLQSGSDRIDVSRDSVGDLLPLCKVLVADCVNRIGSLLGFWTNFYQERLYQ